MASATAPICTSTCPAPGCQHGPSISPRWAPIGGASGEPLYFGQLDEPDVETRHLLSFDAPVLADSTHLSTFYFECAEARDHAAAALGAAWDA